MTDTVPLVDLVATHAPLRDELLQALAALLDSGEFIGGPAVEGFERELTRQLDVPHAIGVASGTAALHLALRAGGIRAGDEVILPANTFFATAEAVAAVGATPVLVDVDPATALVDAAAVEAAVTSRTAAIIPVHLYGQPVDGPRFRRLAARYDLFLLEDACQAIGAAWHGQPVGTFGHAAAFSFYPGKNLGALGDGGAVTTSSGTLAERLRILRSHGEITKHRHVEFGYCERLDALQAAFLSVKLSHLDAAQASRDAAAAWYDELLAQVPGARRLRTAGPARHVHHLMVVRVPRRDEVLTDLHAAGIGAAVHYPRPIHLQPAGRALGAPGQFPAAEALASSVLSLPLWPGIGRSVVDRIVESLAVAIARTEPVPIGG